MNYGRLALAAVAATIVDAVYGFVVYGMLLASEFARYPGVYRPDGGHQRQPAAHVRRLSHRDVRRAYIYAKGYEGGTGVAEGLRFGVLLGGSCSAVFAGVGNYATLNIGRLSG